MSPSPIARRPLAPRAAFVLLEVLVSLAILGVSLTMIMRSFTVSMRAARQSRDVTAATALARTLIDKWELSPPAEDTLEGDFSDEFSRYSYEARYERETPDYRDVPLMDRLGRLTYFRRVTIDIFVTKGKSRRRLLRVRTALTSSERFTTRARMENEIPFDL